MMKTHSHGTRLTWLALVLAVCAVTVLGLLAVGCGGGEETTTTAAPASTTSTTAMAETTTTAMAETTTTAAANAALDRAQAAVDAKSVPVAYAGPTEPVDMSLLKGKLLYFIASDLSNNFNDLISKAFVEAAEMNGVKVKVFSERQNPSVGTQYVMQGLDEGAVGITCLSIGPEQMPAAYQAAADKGVPMNAIAQISGNTELTKNLKAHLNTDTNALGALMVDYAYVDTIGKGNRGGFLESTWDYGANTIEVDRIQAAGVQAEWKALGLPEGGAKFQDIDLTAFQSKLAPQVQAQLAANDRLNWLLPHWDVISTYVVAGIQASGKTPDEVGSCGWNGIPVTMEMVRDGRLTMDVGASLRYWGWAAFDQMARLVTKQWTDATPFAVTNPDMPCRIFDQKTLQDLGTTTDDEILYGSAYVGEFKKLWGVQ